jgi:hypothetical protein
MTKVFNNFLNNRLTRFTVCKEIRILRKNISILLLHRYFSRLLLQQFFLLNFLETGRLSMNTSNNKMLMVGLTITRLTDLLSLYQFSTKTLFQGYMV